jgi:beta-lactamase class C
MKDKTRRHRTPRRTRRFPTAFALPIGMFAMLLPMAAGLSAQSSLRWDSAGQPAGPIATGLYSTHATMTRVYPGAGLSVVPLAKGFEVAEFEALAENLVASGKVPGLAMAIVHQGRVLSARGYGVTDLRQPEAVDAHTVFRLASLSKSFAATATGLLVNEGRLRWDSRVVDYYPTLQFSDPDAALRLTVADVLSHRVGIGHNAFDRDLEGNAEYPSLVRKMAYVPMQCAPGECYAYQNIAYSLIGDVIGGSSGRPYEQWVAQRLFQPLGMHDASYGLDGILASARWAKPHVKTCLRYVRQKKRNVCAESGWGSLTPKPTYYRVAPAAGVNASISDMAQWLIAQTGHRPDVLPSSLLATLHAPLIDTPGELRSAQWRRDRLNGAGYGLGWRVFDYAGHRVVFHGGAVQGYRGAIALIPERDLGVVVLWNANSGAPSGLMPTILDRAIGATPQRWLEGEPEALDEGLYAQGLPKLPEPANATGGAEGSVSNAKPK